MKAARPRSLGLMALLILVVLACLLGMPATLLAKSGENWAGVDQTAPTIGGWQPAGPIENTTLHTFVVNVSDEESGVDWVGITKESVQVADGILHGVIPSPSLGEVQITIKAMYIPGANSVTLRVADNAGNIATSTHRFELIDSAPPVFGPWHVDGEMATGDVWIVADSAEFRVHIKDEYPTLGMDSVTASLDDGPGTSVLPDSDGYYAILVEGLEDGPHSLSFTATDRSRNSSTSTLSFNISLSGLKFMDPFPANGFETCNTSIAPNIRIEEIPPNAVDAAGISWTMTGPGGYVTGEPMWADSVSTYTPSSLLTAEGEYLLSVTASNLEGLSSRYPFASGTWSFLLDTTAPERAVCAAVADTDGKDPVDVAGVQYTADPTASIRVTVWDNEGGSGFDNAASPSDIAVVVVGGSEPGIEVPGIVLRGERPSDSAGPWAATWTAEDPLASGTYYYQVFAVDDAGNQGVITGPGFTFVVDRTPPGTDANAAVGSCNTSNLRYFTNNPRIHVTWGASTDGGNPGIGLLGYELEIRSQAGDPARDAGVLIHTAGSLLQLSGDDMEQYTSETLPVSSGTPYTVWIRAIDLLGNKSDWFGAPFVFDSGRPGKPGKPVMERGQKAGDTLSFRWTHASDARVGVAQSGVDLYEFQIKAVDNPRWDVLDAAVSVDMIEDEDVDSVDPDTPLTGDCAFTLPTRLIDGNYVARVRAKDVGGNCSDWVESDPFQVRAALPAVPEMIPLPAYTKGNQVIFTWLCAANVASYDFKYSIDSGHSWTTLERIAMQTCTVNVRDVPDGKRVMATAMAYNEAGNGSGWAEPASTTVDRTGPAVAMMTPVEATAINLSTFTWTWTANDGERGSGVCGYWAKLNDEAWSWTTEPVFTSSRLQHGANILRVKGVDNAGNEGAATAAYEVTLVDAVVFDIRPEPGAHAINEVSTIAFSVAGLHNGTIEVLLGSELLEDDWRLVTVVRTPELAKFYILLDADVMQPGMLTVTIRIGDVTKSCDYRVLSERRGFGFGRLRP